MAKDLFDKAYDLINFVVIKYGVTNYDDFTCPFHRALAEELKYFADEELNHSADTE